MNDRIIQLIRTFWPGAIAWLLAQAIAQNPAVADWIASADLLLTASGWPTSTQTLLTAVAVGATLAGYVALVQWLSKLPKIGPWIARLGLGSAKTPTYIDERADDGGATLEIPVSDLDGYEPKHRA